MGSSKLSKPKSYRISTESIPQCGPLEHTMTSSLNSYVEQKLPSDLLDYIAVKRIKTCVEGGHLRNTRYHSSLIDLDFSYNARVKSINQIRARWCYSRDGDGGAVVRVIVQSGYDYTRHVASLILHALKLRTSNAEDLLSTTFYVTDEIKLSALGALNSFSFPTDGCIIIGLADVLSETLKPNPEKIFDDELITLWRMSKNILLFGFKISFWGRLAGRIVRALCTKIAPREVIYFGKLGTLTHPSHIYNKIFSPERYVAYDATRQTTPVIALDNGLRAKFPEIVSGLHASVPTILEETFSQEQQLRLIGVTTIDNEISFIAREIQRINIGFGKSIIYTPIHYATDYLRASTEWSLKVRHDLSNNRSTLAKFQKHQLHEAISELINSHLEANYL